MKYCYNIWYSLDVQDLQSMIEPVKVELVDTILLFHFMDWYIHLITGPLLPE